MIGLLQSGQPPSQRLLAGQKVQVNAWQEGHSWPQLAECWRRCQSPKCTVSPACLARTREVSSGSWGPGGVEGGVVGERPSTAEAGGLRRPKGHTVCVKQRGEVPRSPGPQGPSNGHLRVWQLVNTGPNAPQSPGRPAWRARVRQRAAEALHGDCKAAAARPQVG